MEQCLWGSPRGCPSPLLICFSLSPPAVPAVYTIYMGKDKYESKWAKSERAGGVREGAWR